MWIFPQRSNQTTFTVFAPSTIAVGGPTVGRQEFCEAKYPAGAVATAAESIGVLTKKQLGQLGEAAVADFLLDTGKQVLARNWRNRCGELDLIIADGGVIAAVEVKTRSALGYGTALEAVTPQKLTRLKLLLHTWVRQQKALQYRGLRIDVAGVVVRRGAVQQLEYLVGVADV
nr:YraN family protein [Canibacter oris]